MVKLLHLQHQFGQWMRAQCVGLTCSMYLEYVTLLWCCCLCEPAQQLYCPFALEFICLFSLGYLTLVIYSETENALPIVDSLPKHTECLRLGKGQSREPERQPRFPVWVIGTQPLETSLLLPKLCIHRRLESGAGGGNQTWKLLTQKEK